MRIRFKVLLSASVLSLAVLAQGCATKKVQCGGRLEPINQSLSDGADRERRDGAVKGDKR